MSDIFQEVDEEVRRDKALEFWKKHQNLIIAGAALIVLATGGYRFYENRKLAEIAHQVPQAARPAKRRTGNDALDQLPALVVIEFVPDSDFSR